MTPVGLPGKARKKAGGTWLCRTTALDDLTKKQRRQMDCVLRALKAAGCFSSFDVDDALAPTITAAFTLGYVEAVGDRPYPWTNVRLTSAGERRIEP